ncbi:DUF6966 domain-containing protein [Terrihabitans rhizophilus]|uniref:DUF6966 domain-containing protein n=1 Tax=Terrihabitans rhizophilus TaxID=3092662 RepID=UPI003CC60858
MQLHPEVAHFARLLASIEEHLTRYGDEHWSPMVRHSRASIERSDAYGLVCFLRLFGGMGSINDLLLWKEGRIVHAATEQLREMLAEASSIAHKLQREAEKRPE